MSGSKYCFHAFSPMLQGTIPHVRAMVDHYEALQLSPAADGETVEVGGHRLGTACEDQGNRAATARELGIEIETLRALGAAGRNLDLLLEIATDEDGMRKLFRMMLIPAVLKDSAT